MAKSNLEGKKYIVRSFQLLESSHDTLEEARKEAVFLSGVPTRSGVEVVEVETKIKKQHAY